MLDFRSVPPGKTSLAIPRKVGGVETPLFRKAQPASSRGSAAPRAARWRRFHKEINHLPSTAWAHDDDPVVRRRQTETVTRPTPLSEIPPPLANITPVSVRGWARQTANARKKNSGSPAGKYSAAPRWAARNAAFNKACVQRCA